MTERQLCELIPNYRHEPTLSLNPADLLCIELTRKIQFFIRVLSVMCRNVSDRRRESTR